MFCSQRRVGDRIQLGTFWFEVPDVPKGATWKCRTGDSQYSYDVSVYRIKKCRCEVRIDGDGPISLLPAPQLCTTE